MVYLWQFLTDSIYSFKGLVARETNAVRPNANNVTKSFVQIQINFLCIPTFYRQETPEVSKLSEERSRK